MTSFILISQNKANRQQYIQEFIKEHSIDPFDLTLTQKEETSKNLQSLGIEDVKTLQKKLHLKPLISQYKLVVLEDAHLLTIEAQNALLKVLEEPPDHTYIILGSETKEVFLSTILSRCQLIFLEEPSSTLTSEEEKELAQFLTALLTMRVGDKLKNAELLIKNKVGALLWVEKVILSARLQLLKAPNPQRAQHYATFIKRFQTLHTQLKTTNVNPRFALENTLLQFSV